MFEIKKQGNNGRKPLATLGNLKLACVELGIPDDKHTLRRASRAFDIYFSDKVEHVNDHTFLVKSQYAERLPYQVWISSTGISYCTCKDWQTYSGDLVVPDVHFHCKHSISARIWLHHNGNGNGSKLTSVCGTKRAQAIQDKLNGNGNNTNANDGKGDAKSPSYKLDATDPFQESELLDIAQIESRSNGNLAHKLSNEKWVISYNGIMSLASKNGVTFTKHTVKSDAQRNGTVIAYARLGTCTRASGKPMNGSFITAVELAKRNAARQLLPLPEIKALEHKAKLEADFDWQVAKRKCLEIVPDFTLDILLNDLVRDGKLEQKHPSDYSRREWLVIYDAVKKDIEINGNDDDDNNGGGVGSSTAIFSDNVETVPSTESEFVERCKQAEKESESEVKFEVDDTATAPMLEGMDGDGKRKLRMDKKKNIVLIEPDGTQTPITMRDTAFTYGSNYVLRLTQGIACGGDISTVELDN